jgi:AraC family transcriptional regulator, transcriptional activator of pobA
MNQTINHFTEREKYPVSTQIKPGIVKKAYIEVYRIEENSQEGNTIPTAAGAFKIIWVTEGSGSHLIDIDKYEIAANTVHCVVPGRLHFFNSNANTKGYRISFTPDFLNPYQDTSDLFSHSGLFNSFLNSAVIKLGGQLNTEMNEIAEKLEKEFQNAYPGNGDILRELLKIFLIYINRQAAQAHQQFSQTRNAELASKFLTLLEQNYITKKMVANYASDLSVTPNYLNEVVKKVSGFPASYHIQQRVVLEAKRKATYVKMSMKEIAYHLGFDDISHFSKFFKNVSGINFSDFKKGGHEEFFHASAQAASYVKK